MAKGYGQGNQPSWKSGAIGSPPGKFKARQMNAVGPGGKGSSQGRVKTVSVPGKRVGGSLKQGGQSQSGTIAS